MLTLSVSCLAEWFPFGPNLCSAWAGSCLIGSHPWQLLRPCMVQAESLNRKVNTAKVLQRVAANRTYIASTLNFLRFSKYWY